MVNKQKFELINSCLLNKIKIVYNFNPYNYQENYMDIYNIDNFDRFIVFNIFKREYKYTNRLFIYDKTNPSNRILFNNKL